MTFNSKPEMLLVTLVRYAKKKSFSETNMKNKYELHVFVFWKKLFELLLLGIFLTNHIFPNPWVFP